MKSIYQEPLTNCQKEELVRWQAKLGTIAPEFCATAYVADRDEFKDISLSDYQEKWLCLYFYPMDFTFVCPTEIQAFDHARKDFSAPGCELLACSTDSHYVHKGWVQATEELRELTHPLLADITKQVSAAYGVLIDSKGVPLRGTFLIDPEKIIRYMSVNDLQTGRNVDEILRVLDALQTGEMCPCNWTRGEKTL